MSSHTHTGAHGCSAKHKLNQVFICTANTYPRSSIAFFIPNILFFCPMNWLVSVMQQDWFSIQEMWALYFYIIYEIMYAEKGPSLFHLQTWARNFHSLLLELMSKKIHKDWSFKVWPSMEQWSRKLCCNDLWNRLVYFPKSLLKSLVSETIKRTWVLGCRLSEVPICLAPFLSTYQGWRGDPLIICQVSKPLSFWLKVGGDTNEPIRYGTY